MTTRPCSTVVNQHRCQLLIAIAMGITAVVAAATALAAGALAQHVTSAVQIEHHIAKIDGTRFHYVTAGSGDPVLLLPGWPESWIAWRKVLPLLVNAGRSVVRTRPSWFR